VFIQRVPEPKSAKNRMHLDVNVGGGHGVALDEKKRRVHEKVGRLVAAGGTEVEVFDLPDRGEYWIVMQDPEGNEFCVQ
jgi:hypothetical protein